MSVVVPLDVAKAHLRITDSDHDADIQGKAAQATATIIKYLKSQGDPAWDWTTVPGEVQAAILLYLAQLYEHRGDDLAPNETDSQVWYAIERLLMRLRDPALA